MLQSLERNAIPKHLTRRHCVSKVAEIYDLVGKITPLTAMMKCDLHELVSRKLDWDDIIPDSLRHIWESHFDIIQNIKGIKFNRAVIPDDAISLVINTIDTGDASHHLACAAIYARFKRKSGNYSCQLILSRSKLVPQGMSQCRAELFAATLNSYTGKIVKRSLQTYHKSSVKFTNSQIVLHWLHNENKQLKQWTRNRVIEIHRFADKSLRRYISSTDVIADSSTRRGATLKDISAESAWINGYPWMKLDVKEFRTIEEIKLNQQELNAINTETQIKSIQSTDVLEESSSYIVHYKLDKEQIEKRYIYSEYLIDPNQYRFNTVVRIIAIIKRLIDKLKQRVNLQKGTSNKERSSADTKLLQHSTPNTKVKLQVILSEEKIKNAENHFFQKATAEIKHFMKENQYKRISKEKEGMLYYTGRILPNQNVTVDGRMTNVMKDLQQTSFCVAIINKRSPLAYSIVNEIHWYNNISKHAGIETVLRCTLSIAYITEGQEIVRKVKNDCHRYRLLDKRTIEVSMGPVSTYNLTIAPAFYYSQVDLVGPFKAYTSHSKRKAIKIWLCVFCCSTN